MTAKKNKIPCRKKQVVFVCTGNTCRSPMAEQIFKYVLRKKRKLSLYSVTSAGLSVNSGDKICENSIFALKALGIKAEKTLSKILTRHLFETADLIICMTEAHKKALPEKENVYSIGELTGAQDVADPFGQSEDVYKSVAEYLLYACEDVFKKAEQLNGCDENNQ